METDGILVLVQRARARDQKAWDEIFRRAQPYLLNLAAHLMRGRGRGESLSHILGLVWQRGWRGVGKFRGASEAPDDETATQRLMAWLRQVVRSAVLNEMRSVLRHSRMLPLSATDPDSTMPPNGIVATDQEKSVLTRIMGAEERVRLRQALAAFSEEDRNLIVLIFSGQQSIRQIAQARDCHESTLRDHRDKMLKRLRALMERQLS